MKRILKILALSFFIPAAFIGAGLALGAVGEYLGIAAKWLWDFICEYWVGILLFYAGLISGLFLKR